MKNGLKGLNTKHIGLLNANIGVRPIGPDMALIAGIYSTIGRHTATSPSWHSVNIPEEHNNTANRLLSKKDTIKAYHTLALQLAFSLPNGAAYLKTFRPVHSSFSSLQRHSWALSIQLEM
jgi:hypothetical protein